jgi:hypothetical protein
MFKRVRTLLLTTLLLTAGWVSGSWAELPGLGIPIDPHGYPAFYLDANGLALEPCLPPPAGNATREDLCVFEPLDLASPILVAGEIFWWMGDASVAMPGTAPRAAVWTLPTGTPAATPFATASRVYGINDDT